MSTIQSRADLIAAFASGQEPDGDEYMVLINSLVHTTEDDFRFGLNDYIDGSIGNPHEGFFYPEGRCSVHANAIYRANKDTTPGIWVDDDWDFLAGVVDATDYIKRIGTTVSTGFSGDTHYETGIALHGLDADNNIVNSITLNKETTIPAPTRTTYAGFTGVKDSNLGANTSCYWDIEVGTTPHPESNGDAALGKSTTNMKTQANYTGWDFTNIWAIAEGSDYPKLISNIIPAYAIGWNKISTPQQLQDVNLHLDQNYIVINDIDMTGFSWTTLVNLTGILDLNGFTISNLTKIVSGTNVNQALFISQISGIIRRGKFNNCIISATNAGPYDANSYITGFAGLLNNGALVEDIQLANIHFNMNSSIWVIGAFRTIEVGGTVNRLKIDTLSVNRNDCDIYAFTENSAGNTQDCQAVRIATTSGPISGKVYGFAFQMIGVGSSNINYLASTGASINSLSRGLLLTPNGGTMTNCYYDSTTSGQGDTINGSIPKTTTQLHAQITYIGFDFTNIWAIAEGSDYALLKPYISQFVILEDDEIPIYNATDFSNIRNKLDGKYSIMNNISFSSFGTILTPIAGFKGRLKGNGLTIDGITIDSTDSTYTGLPYKDKVSIFSYTEKGADFEDIRFTNITLVGKPWSGSLDNELIVSPLIADAKETIINKVYCQGTIEFNNNAIVGGFIGQEYGCSIADCGTKLIMQSDMPINPNTIVGGFFGIQSFYDGYEENIVRLYSASEVPQVAIPGDSILRQLVIESLLGAMAISLGGKFELQCSNLLITGDLFSLQTLLAYTRKRHSEFGPRSIPDCEWVINKLTDNQLNSQFSLTVLNVSGVNVIHSKNKKAIIQCFDQDGNRCNAAVQYINNNQLNVSFKPLFTGTITAD